MSNQKQTKMKQETTTDFTIECAKIESITGNRGMVTVEIKEGYIYPQHEKYVVRTFSDSVLIEELKRRHDNITLIFNEIPKNND